MSNENVELDEKPNKKMSHKNKRKFSTEEWNEGMAIRKKILDRTTKDKKRK